MKITTDPINVPVSLLTYLEAKKVSLEFFLKTKNFTNYEQLNAFCNANNLIICDDPFKKEEIIESNINTEFNTELLLNESEDEENNDTFILPQKSRRKKSVSTED